MRMLILSVLAVSILSGCGVYTTYERPKGLPTDRLYGSIPVQQADTSSLATLSWRKLFNDPCLQSLIEKGLANNTNLRTAQLKTEEAQASAASAKLAFLPSLSLAPQGTLSSFDGAKSTKTYSLGASASWELDIFGRLRNAKEQARLRMEQSENYRQAVSSGLVATIAENYYTLLMLDKQIDICEKTVAYWIENVRTTNALKNAGKAGEQAVAQSEANLRSVQSSLVSLTEQVSIIENTLCSLLGETPHTIERGTLDAQKFPENLSVGLPIQLLANRPDVRQAESALAEAFYATNEARSAFYPSVTLSGSIGFTNNSGMMIVNPGKWLLNAVGSLVQPIFQKGVNVARLKIAKAQQEEALLAFRQSLLDAGMEVNKALTQWQSACKRCELDCQQVSFLERAAKSAELTMQYGNTTYLEVLTARQALLQAELTAVSDRFDEINGIISLYHALGGGVD